MKTKYRRIAVVLLLVCLVSAPFASAQYTDSITVLGGLGGISRDALEEMLDLVACKCAGGGGCECGGGVGGACACGCTCEICTFLKAHPVGSIYMSMSPADPQTTYGGEWEQWGQGRVPVGAAGNGVFPTFTDFDGVVKIFAPGETGGEYRHTLTIPEIPGHTHLQDPHTHIQDAHTHLQNAHTHIQNPHTHLQNPHDHPTNGGWGPGATNTGMFRIDVNSPANRWSNVLSTTATNQDATATNQNATAVNQNAAATNQSATATNQSTGGNGAHNNMQPYVTCYMWRRTGEGTSLCTSTGCNCGGGGPGSGGCDCEPYTATLPISITDNDISIDLSGYVTSTSLATTLGDYVMSTSLATILAGYVTSTGLTTALGSNYTKTEIDGKGYLTDVTVSGTGNPITATKAGSEVDLTFGTLGVSKGGTGVTSFTGNRVLMSNAAGNALAYRAITDASAVTGSLTVDNDTNLITADALNAMLNPLRVYSATETLTGETIPYINTARGVATTTTSLYPVYMRVYTVRDPGNLNDIPLDTAFTTARKIIDWGGSFEYSAGANGANFGFGGAGAGASASDYASNLFVNAGGTLYVRTSSPAARANGRIVVWVKYIKHASP